MDSSGNVKISRTTLRRGHLTLTIIMFFLEQATLPLNAVKALNIQNLKNAVGCTQTDCDIICWLAGYKYGKCVGDTKCDCWN